MPLRCIVSYLLTPAVQIGEKVAHKIAFDGPGQVDWIFRPKHKPGFARDDLIFQGPNIGCENW
jgi:hypothetical protein